MYNHFESPGTRVVHIQYTLIAGLYTKHFPKIVPINNADQLLEHLL